LRLPLVWLLVPLVAAGFSFAPLSLCALSFYAPSPPVCFRALFFCVVLVALASSGGGDHEGFIAKPIHPKPLMLAPLYLFFLFSRACPVLDFVSSRM
jgi:hypothetical protein